MAGGGQLKVERQKRGKSSNRKKMKRVGFHLDMTPLVDITFLLLTFFMFTTTMATPQVMEISVPPEQKVEIEVPASLLRTIYVRDDNKIFYQQGDEDATEISLKEIKGISIRENLIPDLVNKLIIALKPSENSDYGVIVSILDELNLAEVNITKEIGKQLDESGNPKIRERRFTIAPMNEDEIAKIKDL